MSQEARPHDHHTPAVPEYGTTAAQAYFRAAWSDFGLFRFIIDVVLTGDYVTFVAKQALEGSKEYKNVEPSRLATTDPGRLTTFLRSKRQVLLEVFLARLVDNFQTYLVDLVRAVLHAKPAMLSTRQQTLTLEELLKYDRIEDLVHDVIERRVNALAYEGFNELQSWCAERGLEIQAAQKDRDAVVELIAARNVIAHNRSVVDEKYMRTTPTGRFSPGEVRKLEVDDFFGALTLLHRVVSETDHRAAEKFQLPTGPLHAAVKPAPSISEGEKALGDDHAPPGEPTGAAGHSVPADAPPTGAPLSGDVSALEDRRQERLSRQPSAGAQPPLNSPIK